MIEPAKLGEVLDSIEAEHGPFVLAGLFMREDSPGLWDLVVSAPWLRRGKLPALEKFVRRLSDSLGQEAVFSLSRIVTLNPTDPILKRILREVGPIADPVEKVGQDLFGLPLQQAYILRAHRRLKSNTHAPARQKARRG
jgi:hypothetical protein